MPIGITWIYRVVLVEAGMAGTRGLFLGKVMTAAITVPPVFKVVVAAVRVLSVLLAILELIKVKAVQVWPTLSQEVL